MRPPVRIALAAVAVLAVAVVAALLLRHSDTPPADVPLIPGAKVPDPFAFHPGQDAAFTRRAAAGSAHLLYVLSPGGIEASAARTARWRPLVESAARSAGVDPDTLEGLVLLESAGRPDAITPAGLDGAVGLTQILAETGQNLLGMHVDVAASRGLTAKIARAHGARAARLEHRRAQVDQRFDPRAELAATARYLALARKRFGRADLAFVSYHMGMGNLEGVVRAYAGDAGTPLADLVAGDGLSYPRLYFDSSPVRHPGAWSRMSRLGDDSMNYLWKVLAGAEIMRLHRQDPGTLHRLAGLHASGAAAVLRPVLTPPGSGDLVPVPDRTARTGLRLLDRGGRLRRETLGLALYLGAQVRALSRTAPLQVTATVRPRGSDPLDATGWTFDIARRYRTHRQALAFQFVLDRLQTLGVIAWTREANRIHITAGPDARLLLPLVGGAGR